MENFAPGDKVRVKGFASGGDHGTVMDIGPDREVYIRMSHTGAVRWYMPQCLEER